MKNLFKKLIEWLKILFGHSPTPSPTPKPSPSPSPSPDNQPVTVMITNAGGSSKITGVEINKVFVKDIEYPILPGEQKAGMTIEKKSTTTVTVYFDDISINEHVIINNNCIDLGQTDMCVAYPINTIYGVTIMYMSGSC